MRKSIARWLRRVAQRLDHEMSIESMSGYEPKRLGIGYSLTKSDVRKFRGMHPEYKSHRQGLDALIDDTKRVILGNIARGLFDNKCIEFKVRKSLWSAEVTGTLNVYVPACTEINDSEDGAEEG